MKHPSLLDSVLQEGEPKRIVARRYVGLILFDTEGDVVLQKRDAKPGIVNPGLVTFFGGVIENEEEDHRGIAREIQEELAIMLDNSNVRRLGSVDKVEMDSSVTRCVLFVSHNVDLAEARLQEGERIERAPIQAMLERQDLSPVCRLGLETIANASG